MKDKCLEHLLTLVEAGRVLRNGTLKDATAWEDFEVELVRAEDYLSSIYFPNRDVAIANLRKHRNAPTLPLTEGSTLSNRKNPSQADKRPISPPSRPTPRKPIPIEKIRAAVKLVKENRKLKVINKMVGKKEGENKDK